MAFLKFWLLTPENNIQVKNPYDGKAKIEQAKKKKEADASRPEKRQGRGFKELWSKEDT